jgi:hypothetical protein
LPDVTLTLVPWAPGTPVGAYPRRSEQMLPEQPPTGVDPRDTQLVSAQGSLTYTALDPGEYWAAAPIDGTGVWQYVAFVSQIRDPDATDAELSELDARVELLEADLAELEANSVPAVNLLAPPYSLDNTGATDVAAALGAAIAAITARGQRTHIPAGRYKLGSGNTVPIADGAVVTTDGDQTIFDCSAWTHSTYVAQCSGTAGAPQTLAANANEGDRIITGIPSTAGWAQGDYLKVYSTNIISSTGMMPGEFVRIENVDSATQVTVSDPLLDSYTTANAAKVSKWAFKSCSWEGGQFIGPTDSTVLLSGLSMYATRGVRVSKTKMLRIHNAGVPFSESIGWRASDCHFQDAKGAGLAYGVTSSYTCQDGVVVNCTSLRGRHLVAVGGGPSYSGFSSRIAASNCTASEVVDSGFDCHPGGREIHYSNCHVKGSDSDGITFQGSSGSISDCSTRGVGTPGTSARFAILVQPLTTYALNIAVKGNRVESKITSTERGRGICVTGTAGWENYEAIVISDNTVVDAYNGIEVTTPTAIKFSGLVVADNIIRRGASSSSCITVTKAELATITGNVATMTSSSRSGIKLDTVIDSTVSANVLKINGSTNTFGVNCVACADLEIIGNRCIGGSTSGTGIALDNATTNCKVAYNGLRQCPTPISPGTGTGHQFTGNSTGAAGQVVATDADFTLAAFTSPEQTIHTGTLTANRVVTLSTTNAYLGLKLKVARSGAGAFNLTVGAKALATNQWSEHTFDGAAWVLTAFGGL